MFEDVKGWLLSRQCGNSVKKWKKSMLVLFEELTKLDQQTEPQV